jgi:hypothetical protein
MTTTMAKWAIHFYIPLKHSDGTLVTDKDITYIKNYATMLFDRCDTYPVLEGIQIRLGAHVACDKRIAIKVWAGETPDLFDRIFKLGWAILKRCQQQEVLIVGQPQDVPTLTDSLYSALAA